MVESTFIKIMNKKQKNIIGCACSSTTNKGQSTVNYYQSPVLDNPYLSCNDHYFYFLEILLNNLELDFLEFKHIYKHKEQVCLLLICSFFLLAVS